MSEQKNMFVSIFRETISGYRNIIRVWVFVAGILILLLVFVHLLLRSFRSASQITEVEITENGAYIINFGERRTIQWLFSASSLWASSGVEVNKGDKIHVEASGQVNLALHHLVKNAGVDKKPFFQWVGADGISKYEHRYYKDTDDYRGAKIIAPDARQGVLLMQIVPNDQIAKMRPESESLYIIGSNKRVEARQTGVLHFALNDIPLDKSMKDFYLISRNIDSSFVNVHPSKEQIEAWNSIVKDEYWNVWFDDNIGFFLISIEVK